MRLNSLIAFAVVAVIGISGASDPDQVARPSQPPAIVSLQARAKAALEQALKLVSTVDDPDQRVWVRCQIACAQARAELREDAAATLRKAIQAALDSETDDRLIDVAECAAQLGDAEAAGVILNALDAQQHRNSGLARICAAQARRGDFKGARVSAARIQGDKLWQGQALRAITAALADAKDFQAAHALAATISEESEKAGALAIIAAHQLRAGDKVTGLRTLRAASQIAHDLPASCGDHKLSVLAQIAGIQAEAGRLEDARQTAQEINHPRLQDLALQNIVTGQVERGDLREALQTAGGIRDDTWKGDAVKQVVTGLVRAKDLTTAMQVAGTIKLTMWRGYAMLEIAKAQARSGQRPAAADTFRLVLQEAAQAEDTPWYGNVKPSLLSDLARAQASVGEEKAVQAWIAGQSADFVKVYALIGLARGIMEQGSAPKPPMIGYQEEDVVLGSVKVFHSPTPAEEADLQRLLDRRGALRRTAEFRQPQPQETFRGKIILSSCRLASGDPASSWIMALRPDGAALETVLELKDGRAVSRGRISADGRRLALSVKHAGNDHAEICILELNGLLRKIADDGNVEAWSPDGARLACTRGKFQAWESFLLDVATGQEQQLPLPKTDVVNDWSPDGRRLAVMAGNPDKTFEHPTKGTYPLRKIYLVKTDGSEREDLKADPLLDNLWPRFSPDGKQLVYHQRKHQEGRVLHDAVVYGLQQRDAKEILDFNAVFKGNRRFKANGFPCWSPDGTYVVWMVPRQRTPTGTVKMELVFASPVTGAQKRLDLYEMGIRFGALLDWR